MSDNLLGDKVVRKIYADGRLEEMNETMNLRQLQDFVGGYVQYVGCRERGLALVVDETGWLKRKPFNRVATELLSPAYLTQHGVRGDALIVRLYPARTDD